MLKNSFCVLVLFASLSTTCWSQPAPQRLYFSSGGGHRNNLPPVSIGEPFIGSNGTSTLGSQQNNFNIIGVIRVEQNSYNVMMYPNPTSDQLTIRIDNAPATSNFVVKVYDILGKVLITEYNVNNQVTISLSNLPMGLYNVKLSTNDGKDFSSQNIIKI